MDPAVLGHQLFTNFFIAARISNSSAIAPPRFHRATSSPGPRRSSSCTRHVSSKRSWRSNLHAVCAPAWYRSLVSCLFLGANERVRLFSRNSTPFSLLASSSTGKVLATWRVAPRSPSTSRRARGPSFFTSSSAMDSSLACQRRALKEYSLRRAGSPSNLSTPALSSEDVESSVVVLNVIRFRTSSIATAQNAEPLASLCMWGPTVVWSPKYPGIQCSAARKKTGNEKCANTSCQVLPFLSPHECCSLNHRARW